MASIVKRKNTYSVVYNYINEHGESKQKWEKCANYKEAQKLKTEIEHQQLSGTFVAPVKQTVEEFLNDFVVLYGEKKWGVSSYDNNCALIANYITRPSASWRFRLSPRAPLTSSSRRRLPSVRAPVRPPAGILRIRTLKRSSSYCAALGIDFKESV